MTVTLLAAALVMAATSVVGGAAGFAAALLATPLLILLGLDVASVVVLNLAAALAARVATLASSWRLVDRRRVAVLVASSAPAAVLGAVTVGLLDPQVLKTVAGAVVAGIGLYLLLWPAPEARPPGRAAEVIAGATSGWLSTALSLNGPPVAILLTRARLPAIRFVADLAAYFVVANALSLVVLGVGGRIPVSVLWPALPLIVVAALVGNQVGLRVGRRIPQRTFRIVVTCLIIASGLVTIVA